MPVRLPLLGGLFNRAQRRAAADHIRRFDAAGGGRRGNALGTAGPVHSEVAAAAHLVNARARHAYMNNPLLRHGVDVWATYLVGSGCRPTPLVDDAELRRRLSAAFDEHAEEIDATGRTNFAGLLRMAAVHLVVDGEALFITRYDDAGRLRLQMVLPEQLDAAKTTDRLPGGGWITNGVEHDAAGLPVAYWILPHRPHALFTDYGPSRRFDAADVLHVFLPLGAGQVRGISWLAPVLPAAADLDVLTDALREGFKVAAMHAGFLTDMNATGALPFDGDQTGSILESGLEPGTLKVLPAGVDVKFSAPQAAKDAPAFVRQQLQTMAAGLLIPEHLLTGDLTNANYSSLRAGLLPFRARVEQVQYAALVPQLLRPIWRRWLAAEALSGRLDVSPEFAADWIMPRMAHVDPEKELAAVREALALGLTSRTKAVNELGWNADDLDAEIAADRAREDGLRLSFGRPSLKKEPAGCGTTACCLTRCAEPQRRGRRASTKPP